LHILKLNNRQDFLLSELVAAKRKVNLAFFVCFVFAEFVKIFLKGKEGGLGIFMNTMGNMIIH